MKSKIDKKRFMQFLKYVSDNRLEVPDLYELCYVKTHGVLSLSKEERDKDPRLFNVKVEILQEFAKWDAENVRA